MGLTFLRAIKRARHARTHARNRTHALVQMGIERFSILPPMRLLSKMYNCKAVFPFIYLQIKREDEEQAISSSRQYGYESNWRDNDGGTNRPRLGLCVCEVITLLDPQPSSVNFDYKLGAQGRFAFMTPHETGLFCLYKIGIDNSLGIHAIFVAINRLCMIGPFTGLQVIASTKRNSVKGHVPEITIIYVALFSAFI